MCYLTLLVFLRVQEEKTLGEAGKITSESAVDVDVFPDHLSHYVWFYCIWLRPMGN